MIARVIPQLNRGNQKNHWVPRSRRGMTTLFFCVSALLLNFATPAWAGTNDKVQLQAQNGVYPQYPPVDYGTGEHRKLVERGEVLAKAGDCIACHTKPGGAPFAGGLPLKTPFGTYFSPNITPDKETGIGKWTDADFIRAMHDGINPQGEPYFPVFPYLWFTKVSKEDLLAIKAYLASIPAVHQKNKEPDAIWPFSSRKSLYGWRMLYFKPGYYKYNPEHSAAWNRGAYLVEGLGHCAMCHTPINLMGAPKTQFNLSGAFIEGFYAPNITGEGLSTAGVNQITHVFDETELINDAGVVRGPMADVDHDSLKYLPKKDLQAIAVYLQTVKSDKPSAVFGAMGKQNLAEGERVYEKRCAMCHDSGAVGAPRLGDTPNWSLRIEQGKDTLYRHAINGYNNMPPKGGCDTCSDAAVRAAVDYILANSFGASGRENVAIAADAPKPLTLADGKQIYQKSCSVCHDDGKLGAPKLGDKTRWAPLIKQNMDVLFENTIKGIGNMPRKGGCPLCTNSEIEAAVKYMVEESKTTGNYSLW